MQILVLWVGLWACSFAVNGSYHIITVTFLCKSNIHNISIYLHKQAKLFASLLLKTLKTHLKHYTQNNHKSKGDISILELLLLYFQKYYDLVNCMNTRWCLILLHYVS